MFQRNKTRFNSLVLKKIEESNSVFLSDMSYVLIKFEKNQFLLFFYCRNLRNLVIYVDRVCFHIICLHVILCSI